tara:strand:+ start:1293 stop:1463 length:171 start_codon:yes stop_codon:yes gene_type:complete
MGMYAFRRMREKNEAAEKVASLTPTLEKPVFELFPDTEKPKPKSKPKKVKLNGDNS